MAGTVIICFTDIVDSTALQTRVGDEAGGLRRRCDAAVTLEELRTQWKAAAAGERRVVMIAGEPGVGRRASAESVGMPGWVERIDRLESGDLEPWRVESS